MPSTRNAFTPPRLAALRWLTDPGRHVPAEIRTRLLGEIFGSPKAIIVGVINGLLFNVLALAMLGGSVFAAFIVFDLALSVLRIVVVQHAVGRARAGATTPTDLYLVTAICWCALQGAIAFEAVRGGNPTLSLLAATSTMALVGPISARNFGAPRYAMLLVCLCELPFLSAAMLWGDRWMLVLLAQIPLFLYGVNAVVARIQVMAMANIQAEHDSSRHARHDALTGLLNRFGLMKRLDAEYAGGREDFIMFYLDLDGFKPINDSFGHPVGDLILSAVADRLRGATRPTDLVCRLGGDEFVVIARRLSPAEGGKLADTLIRAVADGPFLLPGLPPLRVGISVGFACSPEDGSDCADLQRKADMALYEAKRAGRGIHRRFSLHPSPIGAPEPRFARAG